MMHDSRLADTGLVVAISTSILSHIIQINEVLQALMYLTGIASAVMATWFHSRALSDARR
jgi:hypothetical protein